MWHSRGPLTAFQIILVVSAQVVKQLAPYTVIFTAGCEQDVTRGPQLGDSYDNWSKRRCGRKGVEGE